MVGAGWDFENHPRAHAHVRRDEAQFKEALSIGYLLVWRRALDELIASSRWPQPSPALGEETLRGQIATLTHCPVGSIR